MTALDTFGASFSRAWIKTWRRPVVLSFSLVQPMMWMLLFGFLFAQYRLESLSDDTAYLDFLVPGVCCMTVMFGASQSGITWIRDLNAGFLQRMLRTPESHHPILLGKLFADTTRLLLQALLVLLLGYLLGAQLRVDLAAAAPAFAAVALFAFAFSSLSCAIACTTRTQEVMAVFVHVVNMPVLFTSTALVPNKQMPAWLAEAAAWNPLSAAVDAWRAAVLSAPAKMGDGLIALTVFAALTYGWAAAAMRRCRAHR